MVCAFRHLENGDVSSGHPRFLVVEAAAVPGVQQPDDDVNAFTRTHTQGALLLAPQRAAPPPFDGVCGNHPKQQHMRRSTLPLHTLQPARHWTGRRVPTHLPIGQNGVGKARGWVVGDAVPPERHLGPLWIDGRAEVATALLLPTTTTNKMQQITRSTDLTNACTHARKHTRTHTHTTVGGGRTRATLLHQQYHPRQCSPRGRNARNLQHPYGAERK